MPSFANTIKALKEYDANRAQRDKLLDDATTNEEFHHWEQVERAAVEKVQDALYEDTKEYNRRDRCALEHPDSVFLREIVKKYGGTNEEDSDDRDRRG